jgi:hypothetical protein
MTAATDFASCVAHAREGNAVFPLLFGGLTLMPLPWIAYNYASNRKFATTSLGRAIATRGLGVTRIYLQQTNVQVAGFRVSAWTYIQVVFERDAGATA